MVQRRPGDLLMRELKFRAWDRDKKKMMGVAPGVWDEEELSEGVISIGFAFEWDEIYEIMQYTGLKDKNGKEIYECDLVTKDTYDFNEEVYYNANDVGFFCRGYDGSESILESNYEVVGNIHEAPKRWWGK